MTTQDLRTRLSIDRPFVRAVPTQPNPVVRAEAKFAVKFAQLQEQRLREEAAHEFAQRGYK